jgi:hypothetical protein
MEEQAMSADRPYTDADVELVALVTAAHHIVTGQTDADGNNPCACGQWWDNADEPGWDEHIAEVALDALAAAGRLMLAGAQPTQFMVSAIPEVIDEPFRSAFDVTVPVEIRMSRERVEDCDGE